MHRYLSHMMASEKKEPEARGEAFSFVHSDQLYVCQYTRPSNTRHPVRVNRRQRRAGQRDSGRDSSRVEHPLQRYDFSSAQWSGVLPVSVDREPEERLYWTGRAKHHVGVCCAVVGDCAYTFGGLWKYGHAVHELNLETMVWRRVEANNVEDGPMDKENAGMVESGDGTLCLFGGHGPDTGRHQSGATYQRDDSHPGHCLTNELHLFCVSTGKSLSCNI